MAAVFQRFFSGSAVGLVGELAVPLHQEEPFFFGYGNLFLQSPAQIGEHFLFRELYPAPFLVSHAIRLALGIEAVEVFAAPGIQRPGSRVRLDLVEQFLGLVAEVLLVRVGLCQLQQYLCLVVLQCCLGAGQQLLMDPGRFRGDIEALWQDAVFRCPVWLRRPAGGIAATLPELQLCGEAADAQTGKGILREQELSQEAVVPLHLLYLFFVGKGVPQEGAGDDEGQDAQGLQECGRFQAVIHLGGQFPAVLRPPFQVEGRVAHYVVEAHSRVPGADVPAFDGGLRVEEPCHLYRFRVDVAAVEVGLRGHEVEEVPNATGQVRNKAALGGLQAFRNQLTEAVRGEELAVLSLLFRLAESIVIVIVLPVQPV